MCLRTLSESPVTTSPSSFAFNGQCVSPVWYRCRIAISFPFWLLSPACQCGTAQFFSRAGCAITYYAPSLRYYVCVSRTCVKASSASAATVRPLRTFSLRSPFKCRLPSDIPNRQQDALPSRCPRPAGWGGSVLSRVGLAGPRQVARLRPDCCAIICCLSIPFSFTYASDGIEGRR
jgi:hypothetical protein